MKNITRLKSTFVFLTLLFLAFSFSSLGKKNYSVVKIGMCTDVHLPTMHDSEYRITTFIDAMKQERPDFIIELGDFGTPDPKYAKYFDIWNSFPGDKYHVIGNHEMDGGTTLDNALAYRNMTSGYYSFEKNGFQFIVLDGNDKKDPEVKGYRQFVGEDQVSWLKEQLDKTQFPVVIFSHQGLAHYGSADQEYGVENYKQIQQILENHNSINPQKKVIACFNGHTHYDYAENINEIWYITITSMAYHWLGDNYECIRYSEEVDKNFKWIKYTAPFKEPLFTTVEISTRGTIKIAGKKSEWVGPSPWELGCPESLKKYMRPEITARNLKFSLK
ncbi:MAG TPA: metallophosphoesterase [Draconibacterium sp.]|nr:metallophosphoesterase [Draconibacterium sp.]